MDFISMRAIKDEVEDKLDRGKFVDHFVNILKEDVNESRIIQFNGKWGMGKTSILNLVEKKLACENSYICIKFDPWIISSEYKMQITFFNQLKNQLLIKNKKEYKELIYFFSEMSEWVADNAHLFGVVDPKIFLLTSFLNVLNINLRKRIYDLDKKSSKLEKLSELKTEVGKYLAESKIKLVVIIDDVDRLTNKQILEVLMLLKTVANFDNSIYIMPADYEIIYKAVEKELNRENGIDYVGKIFDTVVEVPKSNPVLLKTLLIYNINLIIKEIKITEDKDHDIKIQNTFIELLDMDLLSIRKVNQYINNFKVIARDKYTIVNLYELMILEYIKLFFPQIFKIIINNKKIFTIDRNNIVEETPFGLHQIKSSELISKIENLENEIETDRDKNVFSLISTEFFYNLGYKKNSFQSSNKPGRKSKSVQYPEYYDRYFSGLTDQDVLFEDVLNQVDKIESIHSFVELFKKYISQKNLSNFIYEFEAIDNLQEYMNIDKLVNMIKAVFIIKYDNKCDNNSRGFFEYDDQTKIFYMGIRTIYKYLNNKPNENQIFILDFLKKFEINERVDIMGLMESKKYLFDNYDEIYDILIKTEFDNISDDSLVRKDNFIRLMYTLEKINHERAVKLVIYYILNSNSKSIYSCFKSMVGTRTNLLNGDVIQYIDIDVLKKTFDLTDENIEKALKKMKLEQRKEIEKLMENKKKDSLH